MTEQTSIFLQTFTPWLLLITYFSYC